MNLLAIDTALENCSAGLVAGGRRLLRETTIGRGHAEALMPLLAALFADADLAPASLDRIAVTAGPGSFTGLRVGIAAARGLALVGEIAVVGVPTLLVHAFTAKRLAPALDRPILALLPGRGDDLFGQLFAPDLEPLSEAISDRTASFRDLARARGAVLAGAGAQALGLDAGLTVHAGSAPDLSDLLSLGATLDPAAFPPKPIYVKPPDAAPQAGARIARR